MSDTGFRFFKKKHSIIIILLCSIVLSFSHSVLYNRFHYYNLIYVHIYMNTNIYLYSHVSCDLQLCICSAFLNLFLYLLIVCVETCFFVIFFSHLLVISDQLRVQHHSHIFSTFKNAMTVWLTWSAVLPLTTLSMPGF